MADIRIKDLTTTASSTASDDFIAVDGTTNGTRKLNAFSPTFGGNATVTGTLTVNGGVTTINGNASGTTSYARLQNNGSNISLWGSRAAIDGGTATDVGLFVYGANELSFWTNSTRSAWISSGGVFNTVAGAAVGGALSVASTTASTSTSSGALVVSGGVGVAGNINGGGAILAQGALSSIPAVNYLSTELSSGQGYITCYNGSGSAYLALNYRASQHNFTSNGAVAVQSTTASTSTSSGALVVSGGVGVAKNASIGVNNSTGVLRICDNSFGGDYVVLTTAGTDGTGTYGLFISQSSGSGLNATTGQMASLRVNNAAIVSANSAGPILQLTGTAPTLTGNSSLTFEFTSNTSLTLKMRGTDGVTRSASITFS